MVVAVHFTNGPAKAFPFCNEWLERESAGDGGEALDLVVIDDSDKPVEPVMRGEENGFPRGPFVAFAVTEDYENAMSGVVLPGGVRHASAHGKPMAQRTGGEFHSRDALVGDVSAEDGTVLIMGVEARHVEESSLGQRSVDPGTRMALAEDEAVAFGCAGVGGINPHYAPIQHAENIGHRED